MVLGSLHWSSAVQHGLLSFSLAALCRGDTGTIHQEGRAMALAMRYHGFRRIFAAFYRLTTEPTIAYPLDE
jgi:hypothetical protein